MASHEEDLARATALADFLLLFRADLERGSLQPLEHYSARFPGMEEAIAREYEELVARRPVRAPPVLAARGYRAIEELGRGGQGTVYLAEDLELRRLVAVKALFGSLAARSASRLARLQRETTLLARIDHPGICAVYRAHLDDDPPFLVMRYVRGRTLAELLAEQLDARPSEAEQGIVCPPRSRAELLRLLEFFEGAAQALHVAHRAGVVHRDIKPANLVAGEDGKPVLLDFGLARTLAGEEHGLTRTGEVLGSPAYMPPEQFDGAAGEPDPRTDVYALGVTLFECLTGRRPFEAPSQHQLERAIRFEPLPRVSKWNRLADADLDVVLTTAAEKDRTKRYSTALDLAEELRRVREHRPIRARPASRALRLRRWCQRNPSVATALVLTGLLALGLLAATVLLLREQGRTQEALLVAESRNLAASALHDIEINPRVALEEAIQAHSAFPGIHSRSALYSAIARQRVERVFPQYSQRMTAQLVAGTVSADGTSWIQADKWGGLAVYRTSGAAPTWLGTVTDPTALALAPDGAFGALGEESGTIRWYDLAAARECALRPHNGSVDALAFGPDGALASGGSDHFVRCYTPAGLSTPASEIELPFAIGGLRYSPSGAWLVAWPAEAVGSAAPPQVALIDARSGSVVTMLAGHVQRIDEVAFSPSSTALATASDDCTVRVWELPSGSCRFTAVHPGKLHDLAFSPDGERLLTGFDPGAPTSSSASGAWILSARDGSRQLDLRGHEFRAVVAVDWSADGTRVLTGSYDSTVRVWNAVDGSELSCLRVPEDLVYHARFLDGGRRLFVRQRNRSLVARAETWDPAHRLGGHDAPVHQAVFSPDSQRIASADASGVVLVHDARGALLARLQVPAALALAFVRDGQELLVSTRDGYVSRHRVADGAACMQTRFGTEPIIELRAIPARDEFVCTCGSRILRCDFEGRIQREYTGHAAAVTCVDLSPDGRWLAGGGADRSARIFDLDSGRCEHVLDQWGEVSIRPSSREDFDVRFDAGGDQLLRASDDGCLRCYSVSSGALLWHLGPVVRMGQVRWLSPELILARPKWAGTPILVTPHEAGDPTLERLAHPPSGLPTAMDVTPDGRLCLLSSTNGRTQLWDLRDRTPWADIGDDRSAVLCAAFSPDGTTILTGQADGALNLWPVDVERAARLATPTVIPVPAPPAAKGPSENK